MGEAVLISTKYELETAECCTCHMIFAMPADMKKRCREVGGDFHCPSGHKQSYTKTELDRMRWKLDEQTRVATEQAARAARIEKELARVKKRVQAGICTCCKRHFVNLERHMKSKHPEGK